MQLGSYSDIGDFRFRGTEKLQTVPTAYAQAQGAWQSDSARLNGTACCWWWLRSPGYRKRSAAIINDDGSLSGHLRVNNTDLVVRPAIMLDWGR